MLLKWRAVFLYFKNDYPKQFLNKEHEFEYIIINSLHKNAEIIIKFECVVEVEHNVLKIMIMSFFIYLF